MEFIFEKHNSLSQIQCKDIIDMFENEKNKYNGITSSGENKLIKNTKDYFIDNNVEKTSEWYYIYDYLSLELQTNLKEYITKIEKTFNCIFFEKNILHCNGFQIQKYNINEGMFIYHNDFSINNNMYRVLTFIWYLNSIEDGGETEFCGDLKIKPEEGKFIFFPASWCYPHKGIIPKSDNKYIITGWLYIDE